MKYMFIMFFSTSNVFKAEDILKKNGIECSIVPTPATDRAYCGVCIKVNKNISLELLNGIEYSTTEE